MQPESLIKKDALGHKYSDVEMTGNYFEKVLVSDKSFHIEKSKHLHKKKTEKNKNKTNQYKIL